VSHLYPLFIFIFFTFVLLVFDPRCFLCLHPVSFWKNSFKELYNYLVVCTQRAFLRRPNSKTTIFLAEIVFSKDLTRKTLHPVGFLLDSKVGSGGCSSIFFIDAYWLSECRNPSNSSTCKILRITQIASRKVKNISAKCCT
jgi:hypothetical protein